MQQLRLRGVCRLASEIDGLQTRPVRPSSISLHAISTWLVSVVWQETRYAPVRGSSSIVSSAERKAATERLVKQAQAT